MAGSGLASPVVVDGRVTDEKLNELLALQTEYPELDFKRLIDLDSAEGLVELAKDVEPNCARGRRAQQVERALDALARPRLAVPLIGGFV